MKKKYLLIALSVLLMSVVFSSCYVARPHYHQARTYHHYHGHSRY